MKLPRSRGQFRTWLVAVPFAPPARSGWGIDSPGGVGPDRVVPALDEAEAGDSRLGLGGKATPVEQFAFECGEEALADGVIVSIAYGPHGRTHAGLPARCRTQ